MKFWKSLASIPATEGRLRWVRPAFALTILIGAVHISGIADDLPFNNSVTTASRRPERRDTVMPSLRMDVSRVLIPVTVTDDLSGRKVEGLRKEDFRLFEDGVERKITEFFIDDSPVSLGIVLDASKSMMYKIDAARQSISAVLRLSSPEDDFFLVAVQSQPALAQAFTRRAEEIDHSLTGIWPQGWTALYDGIYLGINRAKHASNENRALLVLSDGGDNNSRYTLSEIRGLVRESDVRIVSVSVLGRSPAIEKLALDSGGQAFHVGKLSELGEISASLSAAIHGQYMVAFSPAAANRDGKYHVVKLEVAQPADRPRLHASWRHGYYAPE